MLNAKASEQIAVLGVISPASIAAGTADTAWIDTAKVPCLMAIIKAGVLGASATIDAKFRQAQDSSGTGAKDVSGKAIVQMTKAASDNKQAILDLNTGDLDKQNGFTFVQLRITVATAASLADAVVLGINPRYSPASDSNLTSVAAAV
ncbi:hypothetical protein DYI24_00055 [Rhodopseudomonas sp. BR0C11]|uniref:hypothetical protein n=1 Tax=Rhodopseudomonas sp. BR0C11 TaxID=2269370 RepID=UPI0013E0CC77|nr:hypothetical protein [Rhodopseudomonas sp. BR0C11]NEV75473.1 hypothetical protein [Rhodopseudomonas sp. BR0C11]